MEQWTVQHQVFGHQTFLRNNESFVTTQHIYAMVRRMTILSDYKKKVIDRKMCHGICLSCCYRNTTEWYITLSHLTAKYCSFKKRPVPMCHPV
ncbi:hypothetical protein C0J52_15469 [Blattella germanica]|nr:hypothetical protein C0J52_15469 [Blattella germanica]